MRYVVELKYSFRGAKQPRKFDNYTDAWREAQKYEGKNIPYIIQPVK